MSQDTEWLYQREETVFLRNAAFSLAEVVNLTNTNHEEDQTSENDATLLDENDLKRRIDKIYKKNFSKFDTLVRCRVSSLKRIWEARDKWLQTQKEVGCEPDRSLAQPAVNPAQFSSSLNLVLLVPLLESQVRSDPELAVTTVKLILQSLLELRPLSLKHSDPSLDGLENLLHRWLAKKTENKADLDPIEQAEVTQLVLALFLLSTTRESVPCLIRTVAALHQLNVDQIPVQRIQHHISLLNGKPFKQPELKISRHVSSCRYRLKQEPANATLPSVGENRKHSLATDGRFLYCSDSRGVLKFGTGLAGTAEAYCYQRNYKLEAGQVAWASNVLLLASEKHHSDNFLGSILNECSLEATTTISMPEQLRIEDKNVSTVRLISNGTQFIWIRCLPSSNKTSVEKYQIVVDRFQIQQSSKKVTVIEKRLTLRHQNSLAGRGKKIKCRTCDPDQILGTESVLDADLTSVGLNWKNMKNSSVLATDKAITFLTGLPTAMRVNVGEADSYGKSLSFSLETGFCICTKEISDDGGLRFDATPITDASFCNDVFNNCVWSLNMYWISKFELRDSHSLTVLTRQLGVSECLTQTSVPVVTPSYLARILLRHAGLLGLQSGDKEGAKKLTGSSFEGRLLDGKHLETLASLMENCIEGKNEESICCLLAVLPTSLPSQNVSMDMKLSRILTDQEMDILIRFRMDLLTILQSPFFSENHRIRMLCCDVIASSYPILFYDSRSQRELFNALFEYNCPGGFSQLRDRLFEELSSQMACEAKKKNVFELVGQQEFYSPLLRLAKDEAECIVLNVHDDLEAGPDADPQATDGVEPQPTQEDVELTSPCISPAVRLLSRLTTTLLSCQATTNGSTPDIGSDEVTELLPDDAQLLAGLTITPEPLEETLSCFASEVFEVSAELMETILLGDDGEKKLELTPKRVAEIDNLLKVSMLGLVTLPLLTGLSDPEAKVSENEEDQYDLGTLIQILKSSSELMSKTCSDCDPGVHLSRLAIPVPDLCHYSLESPHPVPDKYRLVQTFQHKGASYIYLKFDSQCGTQYDYDKLTVSAALGQSSPIKLYEFGGNQLGYGGRNATATAWPQRMIRIKGDTVSFNFEMKSNREATTPDLALWGFKVDIYFEQPDESLKELSLISDLSLSLITFISINVRRMYNGSERTPVEVECEDLLDSTLLKKCQWTKSRKSSSFYYLEEEDFARIKLSQDMIKRLRELSGFKIPAMRLSVRNVIQPENMEEAILSSVVRHLALGDIVKNLSQHATEQSIEYFTIMEVVTETHMKISALFRKLQKIAELENKLQQEVQDISEGKQKVDDLFFTQYGHDHISLKDLALICYIKDVDFDDATPQKCIENLLRVIGLEAAELGKGEGHSSKQTHCKTQKIVQSIMLRVELLNKVSINTGVEKNISEKMSRSLQSWPSMDNSKSFKRQISHDIEHSFDDSILQIPKLRTRRKVLKMSQAGGYTYDTRRTEDPRPGHSVLIDQLFQFIGSQPEKAISPWKFLEAVNTRRIRSGSRKYALLYLKQLLSLHQTHILNMIANVIKSGPKLEELTCGGMVPQVEETFGEVIAQMVSLCTKYPDDCKSSIGHLCLIPYQKSEEKILVKSGLVQMLDKFCSTEEGDKNEDDPTSQIAWTGFKVITNRCMTWQEEEEEDNLSLRMISLSYQISVLLTNNLSKIHEISSDLGDSDLLNEILLLFENISNNKMGHDILRQPLCMSKLLSLLLEPQLSPKKVLAIIKLCHVALPLISEEGLDHIVLPDWTLGKDFPESCVNDYPLKKIISLLFAKLSDLLVPGFQIASLDEKTIPQNAEKQHDEEQSISKTESPASQVCESSNRHLSLFLHKREDQAPHDLVQELMSISDLSMLRLTENESVDKVVKLEKSLRVHNKAVLLTDDATVIVRTAEKLAQQGFVISMGKVDKLDNPAERLRKNETMAKERNVDISATDPSRPFISSPVANEMACEIIQLIYSLYSCNDKDLWQMTINDIICENLVKIAQYSDICDAVCTNTKSELFNYYYSGRCMLSVLAVLGAYHEKLQKGVKVDILDMTGASGFTATVLSTSSSSEQVTVALNPPKDVVNFPCPSRVLKIPASRLRVIENHDPTELFRSVQDELIFSLQTLLLPDPSGLEPLSKGLPAHGDAQNILMMTSRLYAEIRTKAVQVLSLFLRDKEFSCKFLQQSCQAVDVLKCLTKESIPSDQVQNIECCTEKLRNLYRDCVKPTPPPLKKTSVGKSKIAWNPSKSFPPLKNVLFSHNLQGITYMADPQTSSGIPRGIVVYANKALNQCTKRFYYEVEILSLGDVMEDTGTPLISIGYAPVAEKKEGAWANPVGTVFLHNNGRVVHYNGTSLLQWRSIRFDVQVNPGDIIGVGWTRSDSQNTGTVYFTYNGNLLNQAIEDVSDEVYPVVHIQRKSTRIKGNFGNSKFAYSGYENDWNSCDEDDDENLKGFVNMPFSSGQDSSDSSRQSSPPSYIPCAGDRRITSYGSRRARMMKNSSKYVKVSKNEFVSQMSHSPISKSGEISSHFAPLDSDSDDESDDESDLEGEMENRLSSNAVLVKLWESKVFPIIRRRFRNEAERRDGLDQIKGALSLGMIDIARQTVEFLYEENGGLPKDLHLPTLEDVKIAMTKLSIEHIKKGQQVMIGEESCNSFPDYFVASMQKTCGIVGEVQEVDVENELILVESYLKEEGVLVRYWYSIDMLKKIDDMEVKFGVTGAQLLNVKSLQIHKELLGWEFALARVYCRQAYVTLLDQSHDEDLASFNVVEEASPMKTMILSSLLLLRDFDFENLLFASNNALDSSCMGNTMENSLSLVMCQEILRRSNNGVSSMFYTDCSSLKAELHYFIQKVLSKGDEDCMNDFVNQVCSAFWTPSDLYYNEEIMVGDDLSIKSSISFPQAAFVVISFKIHSDVFSENNVSDLVVQIQTGFGPYIKTNGQFSSRNIIQYPVDTKGSKERIYSSFPSVMVRSDIVKVSHTGGEDVGIKLYLHSIPSELPLGCLFLEELIELYHKDKSIPFNVCSHISDMLTAYLVKSDVPVILKEKIFLLTSEYIRLCRQSSSYKLERAFASSNLFADLFEELQSLYTFEFDDRNQTRSSTYLQSLFELCLAVTDATGMTTQCDNENCSEPLSDIDCCHVSVKYRKIPQISLKNELKCKQPWYEELYSIYMSLLYLWKRNVATDIQSTFHVKAHKPDDHARLLVLRHVPRHLSAAQVLTSICQSIGRIGGLFSEDFYMIPHVEDGKLPEIGCDANSESIKPKNSGKCVLQVRSMHIINKAIKILEKNKILNSHSDMDIIDGIKPEIQIRKVNEHFSITDANAMLILESYLKSKVFEQDSLSQRVKTVLEEIFLTSYFANMDPNKDLPSKITMKASDIMDECDKNLVAKFLLGTKQFDIKSSVEVNKILKAYGEKIISEEKESCSVDNKKEDKERHQSDCESNLLSMKGFLGLFSDLARKDICSAWNGLNACGYNLSLEKTMPSDIEDHRRNFTNWNVYEDKSLVQLGNRLAQLLNTSPLSIPPTEILLNDSLLTSEEQRHLSNKSAEDLRFRFAFLQAVSWQLKEKLLPLINTAHNDKYRLQTGYVINQVREMLFYDMKSEYLDQVLEDTAQRDPDVSPPEISINPIEEIGNSNEDVEKSVYCQALLQLADVPSSQFNVPLAAGGDPLFPFNVRLTGEEVLGNSGSFRQFLSIVVTQLHSPTLNLLLPYRGQGAFVGRYFLKPGPINYGEEKMLEFLGQILGFSLRSRIPLALDLMPTVWRALVNQPIESWEEGMALDPVTTNYIQEVENVKKEDFEAFLADNNNPTFTFTSLSGNYVELCPDGDQLALDFDNRQEYVQLIKQIRIREWGSRDRIEHIQAGLATIAPLSLITTLFSPTDLELKICGVPTVDIKALRQHTIYQAGIKDTDAHIENFWKVLESFSDDEMTKFVKFSCNQERIPPVGHLETHNLPPPYPMKIAPADRSEIHPDRQLIRVETCIFMIKLPRYTSYQVMREKLLAAMACALDPLSG